MRRGRFAIGYLGIVLLLSQALACAAPPPPSSSARSEPAPAAPAAAAPAQSAPPALTRVTVGHFPATHSSGLYIAYERGYFAELGIEADLIPMQSGASDALVLMSSGQLDVYGGGTGANLYNAAARGLAIRAVADKAHSEAGVKYKALMARKDLWDSGEIRTIADLRGRPVAALPGGGGIEYQIEKVLATARMTVDDIQLKGMTTPDQLAALANKGADAAFLFQPAMCTAEKRDLAVVLLPLLDDVAAGLQGGVINYSQQFMQQSPQVAKNFMVAYVRALRDYNDAQLQNYNRPLIVDIMQKYVTLPDLSYYEACEWGRVNPNGYIDRRWIEDEMLWSVKAGLLDYVVPLDKLVDDSFVDYAIQVLGQYKPAAQ